MQNATCLEYMKMLRIEMTILFESAGFQKKHLEDFESAFWEYLNSAQNNRSDTMELRDDFRKAIKYNLGKVKLTTDMNYIQKAIKGTQALCIEIGALILWGIADWSPEDCRKFIRRCWDMLDDYANAQGRITTMLKESKVKIKYKVKR